MSLVERVDSCTVVPLILLESKDFATKYSVINFYLIKMVFRLATGLHIERVKDFGISLTM